MTRETYAKAGEIIGSIEAKKQQLLTVDEWLKRVKIDFPYHSIRATVGVLANEAIHPYPTEIQTMLLLMKQRLESGIEELEKKLEELK